MNGISDFNGIITYIEENLTGDLPVEEMAKQAGFKQVIIAETGCMISLHSGEKAMGIHFLTK